MEKPTKCQVAKAVLLLILLLFIPFVSSSLRHSYLYILLNILIVALSLEAGFLSKRTPSTAAAAVYACAVAAPELDNARAAGMEARAWVPHGVPRPTVAMRKTAVVVKKVDPQRKGSTGLRRCPSTSKPSIFFIAGSGGGREVGRGVSKEEIEWEGAGEMSKQELFVKAEDFIGNFHMQLRMQREQSGKKIHGLYDHYRP